MIFTKYDKPINIVVKIFKLLENENVTFEEFKTIIYLLNDNIQCQKENLIEDMFLNTIIKYQGDDK